MSGKFKTFPQPEKEKIRSTLSENMAISLSALTRYAIYTVLIFTPLARGSVQDWAVSVIHIVTLTALTAFLLERSLTWKWKRIKTPLDKPIFALLILVILSTIFSMHFRTSFQALMLFVNYIVIFYLVIHTTRTRSQFRQLIYIIIGMATFLSFFGFLKLFGISPFPWWNYTDLSQNSHRLASTFGNPDHLAGYMEMALPLILGLFLKDYKGGRLFVMICLTILILAALILSLSRGGWIGSITCLIFMSFVLSTNRYFRHKGFLISMTVGLLAVALIVLSSTPVVERFRTIPEQKEMTVHGRVTVWKGVIKMIDSNPFTGSGPGTFATVFTQYQPPGLKNHFRMAHNDYLHFISEVGYPLVPVIIWMMIIFYRRVFKKLRHRSRLVRGISLGAMSGVTAILIHSIGDFNLHIPSNALLFSVLAALVMSRDPNLRSRHKSRVSCQKIMLTRP